MPRSAGLSADWRIISNVDPSNLDHSDDPKVDPLLHEKQRQRAGVDLLSLSGWMLCRCMAV